MEVIRCRCSYLHRHPLQMLHSVSWEISPFFYVCNIIYLTLKGHKTVSTKCIFIYIIFDNLFYLVCFYIFSIKLPSIINLFISHYNIYINIVYQIFIRAPVTGNLRRAGTMPPSWVHSKVE